MQHQPEENKKSWLDLPLPSLSFNRETLIFFAIVLIAILTRFYDLETRVMSHDESLHTYFSWQLYQGNGFQHTPLMHGPFQFIALAFSYFLFGDSDFTARIPIALASIISVVFIWQYRSYLGRKGALAAAALFVISPFMLYYGRYVRNDIFVILFGLISLWAVLKYLETGKKQYLYTLSAMMALQFTTKETSFFYTAQILVFLGIFFLIQLYNREWKKPQMKSGFFFLLTLVVVATLLGIGLGGLNSHPAELDSEITAAPALTLEDPTDKPEEPLPVITVAFVGIAGLLFIAAFVLLLVGFNHHNLKEMRSFGLMILLLTLVLPHLSALPLFALDQYPLDYNALRTVNLFGSSFEIFDYVIKLGATLAPLILIAALAGYWWNWREWLLNNLIFYAIFTVFFTTIFTHPAGFFTGLVDSLGYWLEQQAVKRGNQPWYYYTLVQIPIYEFLAAFGTLGAMIVLIKKWIKERKEIVLSGLWTENGFTKIERKTLALSLFFFWTVTSLFTYTIAGEKMPWLTVHIAFPMLMISGWLIGYLINKVNWRSALENIGWMNIVLVPAFLFSLYRFFNSLFSQPRPFSGQELEALKASQNFLVSTLTLLLIGAGMYFLGRDRPRKQTFAFITLILFALMGILTTRASFAAAYENYDDGTEYLVYAHGARGVKDVIEQVEEISRRTTGGLAIEVAFDNDVSWPMTWYLRNYSNQRFYGDNPDLSLRSAPIIIVGDNHFSQIEPVVAQGYYRFDYIRMVWPNQDYFYLTWDRIQNFILDPNMRNGLIEIWLNRDYSDYGDAIGQNITLENWNPSDRMRLYIRRDIVSMLWDYGVAPTEGDFVIDPYEGRQITLAPDQVWGINPDGSSMFNSPRGIALSPDGSIFVADSFNHRIVHLEYGEIVNQWGVWGIAQPDDLQEGNFNEPWGIAVSQDGQFVYVSDTWNHRVQVFTARGEFVTAWGIFSQDISPLSFYGPRDITILADGNIAVSNTGNKRISIFTPDGESVNQFGQFGFLPGDLNEPVGIAQDPITGWIFVADTWNSRVQVFELNLAGNYQVINTWEIAGWYGDNVENKPYIAIDQEGRVFITDPEASRILVYTTDGEFLYYFGDSGTAEEIIGRPIAVIPDNQGGIWVSETSEHRILHFTLP